MDKEELKNLDENIFIGKDILELLSSSMYVNPLSIYREYVQNAVDSIESNSRSQNKININIDYQKRSVVIEDFGGGIAPNDFLSRMLTLGSSKKRGTKQRGFRGVGRLSGLGYCKELIFENSVKGKSYKLIWDCVKLKKILRNLDDKADLKKIILDSTQYKEEKSEQTRNSFRVHLNGLIRVNSDVLISESRIKSYLSCVAPVPFSPKFKFSKKINEILSGVNLANVEIYCNDNETPIYRPHRNKFQISESIEDEFLEVEKIEIESIDNSQAAVGWVMDHNYKGAIPPSALIKGIRIRAGNIQVGDENILQEIFKEKRFNSCVWVRSIY